MMRPFVRPKFAHPVVVMVLLALGAACSRIVSVKGQSAPLFPLQARPANFQVGPDVVAMHYYGAGGWGVAWRGQYLLFAPYFSNHSLVALRTERKLSPKLEDIRAGVKGTPIGSTTLLLIGHGHVDHAGDVGGLFSTGSLPPGQVGLIADNSTVNMLGAYWPRFKCRRGIGGADVGRAIAECVPKQFQVTALHSAHAPHLQAFGVDFEMFGGVVKQKREVEPTLPSQFKLGYPWAFIVDLLDESGAAVFRIHYMDAAAAPPHGLIPGTRLPGRDIDVHIGCVPGFNFVTEYPDEVLRWGQVRYVMAAHWEDFFRPRTEKLVPVNVILDNDKLDKFVGKVETFLGSAGRGVAPLGGDRCTPETCGPRGGTWALPIPGETFQFRAGPQPVAPPVLDLEPTPTADTPSTPP